MSPAEPRCDSPAHRAVPVFGGRIEAIDFARGVAVTLMILSHGVKGLLGFEQIPSWGLVPIHVITKISSTLFILVFGISISIAYLPHVDSQQWPARRKKLLVRGLVVLFWYKVLTVVEMFALYSREDILETLLYQAFPVYVEILGFYAIALLWIPFVLPAWKKTPLWLRLLSPLFLMGLVHFLYGKFEFWDVEPLQAILVEHEQHYTWGQLSRGPLIILGLLAGELIRKAYPIKLARLWVAGSLMLLSAVMLVTFYFRALPGLHESLVEVAKNNGKHPPELQFMLFSLGGALLVLSLVLCGGGRLASVLRPITIIGKNALQAFVCHIFVLFVFYRFLLDYWHNVTYIQALALTALLIGLTALWIKILAWVQEDS